VLAIAGRAEARTSIDEHPQRSNPDARASSWSGHAVEGALILERSLDVVKGASIPIRGMTSWRVREKMSAVRRSCPLSQSLARQAPP